MDARICGDEFPTRNPLAADCRWDGSILPNRDWFMLATNRVWVPKGRSVPKELEFQKIAESDRTCRAWSSGEYEPPVHKLVLLFRGEDGGEFLDIAMNGAAPLWWRQRQEDRRVADLAKTFMLGLNDAGSNGGNAGRGGIENSMDARPR